MPEVDLSSKQDKLIGQQGQVVGFDTDGIATAICGWSNPNLLDNWYFADPINQRDKYIVKPGTPYFDDSWEQLGTTDAYVPIDNFISSGGAYITIGGAKRLVAYPSELVVAGYTGAGYTIDRWRMGVSVCSVLLNPNRSVSSIVLGAGYGQFVQQLENAEQFQGKQLTVSLLCANTDGEGLYLLLNDGKQQVGATIKDGLVSASMNIDENPTTIFCGIQNNNQELVASLCPIAMKLELGPVQTLAHQDASGNWVLNDPPPTGRRN